MVKVVPLGRGCPPNRHNHLALQADARSRSTISVIQAGSAVACHSLSKSTHLTFGFIMLFFATTYLSVISAQGVANFSIGSTLYNCSSNIICLGQAHAYDGDDSDSSGISLGRLSLIQENNEATGIAYYKMPVTMRDLSTQQPASFNTSFTIDMRLGSMANGETFARGDGMTFVISANNSPPGYAGGSFGIFNDMQPANFTSISTTFKSIVVEFDTYEDPQLNDPSDNHVAFDFHNIVSVNYTNAADVNLYLNDTITKYVWVEYSKETLQLEARISYSNSRPIEPLLSYTVNLFDYVDDLMWVGFSSASGDSYSNFYVGDWTFESYGIPITQSSPTGPSATSPTGPSASSPTGPSASSPTGPSGTGQVPTASTPPQGRGKSKRNIVGITVGVSVSIAFLLASTILLAYFVWWRRAGRRGPLGWAAFTEEPMMQVDGIPERFSYIQLSMATKSFSEKTKLGQGGFGSVYRGVLPSSGIPVAVKKISSNSNQGEKEFMAEVSIISQLRHRNLIHLQGWCKDPSKGNYLLVYELMPNGSLDKVLFNSSETRTACLSWPQRFNIVTGIAAAVDYLHQGWNQRVIHRDIKSSNIMLDEEWNPKLGDFGLARMVDHEKTGAITMVAGTRGYMAPELAVSGKFTDKSDVYAFGAVVLEIVCGRRALARHLAEEEMLLVDWVWDSLSKGDLMCTVDKQLQVSYSDAYWIQVVLIIGLLCSHPDPLSRPTMRHALQVLAGDAPVPTVPTCKPTTVFILSDDFFNCQNAESTPHALSF